MAGRLLLFSLFLLSYTAISAQADTLLLEEVSVSVIPFQDNNAQATAGFVSIYVPGLDFLQVLNNADLINLAPGVFMASGTYNTNRLVIRGVGSRAPYGSNRIRAYLDDIPLTSGDGISAIEDIDVFSISSIDIVKGPSSALYGSGLGGIVKMSGRYPEAQGLSLYQSNDFGSYSTFKNSISAGYKKDRIALMAGYSRSSTDGFRENSKFRRNNLFLNARYFGKKSNITATLHMIDLFSQIPSSLNLTDYTSSPEKASGNWLGVEGFEEYLKAMAGVSIETSLGQLLQNDLVLYGKYADPYERRPFNVLDEQSFSYGFRESLSYTASRIKISAGIEYYRDNFEWQTYETIEEGQGLLLSDSEEKRQYLNAFTYAQWRPGKKLIIDAGLNINVLNYELETIFDPNSNDNSGEYSYEPVVSPRLGVNYQYVPAHYMYSSLGHGFSAPSLEETLLPEGSVNLDLKPESGWNMELGERGRFLSGRISYDIAAYAVYLKNLLVTERVSGDIFTGVNAGTVLNTGIEMLGTFYSLKPRPVPRYDLNIILGVTMSNNRFLEFIDDGVSYKDKHLPGIPRQIIHTTLVGKAQKFSTRLQYRYVGSQWMDDANTLSSEDYQLVNFQLSWKHQFSSTSFGIELSAGVKNLFNAEYASMVLVNAPSFGGAAPRYYYPGLPRQIHVGIAIRYR